MRRRMLQKTKEGGVRMRDAEGNSLSRPHLEGRLRGAGDHHCGSEQHASCQFQSNAHNCIIFIYRSISPGTAGLSP